jgi:hypothetical protein
MTEIERAAAIAGSTLKGAANQLTRLPWHIVAMQPLLSRRAQGHCLGNGSLQATAACFSRMSLRVSSNSALSISPLANRSFKIPMAREVVSRMSGSSRPRPLGHPQHINMVKSST